MAYTICEPCIGTKDTACVDVCPVDCIHPRKDEADFEAEEKLYIHPDECIDCGACVPACPVEAIFANDEVPEKMGAITAILTRSGSSTNNVAAVSWALNLSLAHMREVLRFWD